MSTENINEQNDSRMKVAERAEGRMMGVAFIGADAENEPKAEGVCPKCGAVNEPESLFCENCGHRLRELLCPHCGAVLEDGQDYCERCHNYIDTEHCSFCHAQLSESDAFCPECGSSLSGIECPVCHTIGRFGFCASCGTPLTDSASSLMEEVWLNQPYTDKVRQLEEELERLWLVRPVVSDRQKEEIDKVQRLCTRVKQLMAEEGENTYVQREEARKELDTPIMTEEELKRQLLNKQEALQALLDTMEMNAQPNPALARNYAMARKPHMSHLAWKCNYKLALHSSPLCCACPQQGGKWVILDGNTQVLDD